MAETDGEADGKSGFQFGTYVAEADVASVGVPVNGSIAGGTVNDVTDSLGGASVGAVHEVRVYMPVISSEDCWSDIIYT